MLDSIERPSSNRRSGILAISLAFIAVIGATLCRLAGASGELWLDELWSVLNVQEISNPLQLITRLHHDNNHPLNSLWIWLCGVQSPPLLLRAPSVVFGVATIATLLHWGRLMNERIVSTLWALLAAFSYPLILTDSEARGYALSLLCAALCFYQLSAATKPEYAGRPFVWFGLWASLGCFTHATFALFLVPAMMWMFTNRSSVFSKHQRSTLITCGLAAPSIIGGGLTALFFARLHIGGGPELPYLEVAATTLSVAFGGPPLSAASPEASGQALFLSIFIVLALATEMRSWIRTRDPLSVLVCLIIAISLVAVICAQPRFILPRYFLIPVLFSYLIFARFLRRMGTQGRIGTATAVAMLGGYLVGNMVHTVQLAAQHRSHFVEILSDIAGRKSEAPLSVGGQQDFQNVMRLRYANLIQSGLTHLTYERDGEHTHPRFYIGETLDTLEVLPETFTTRDGASYHAIKRYDAPLLNGSNVTVYERDK